ncbi:hypothetical protein GQ43DRAFT_467064 [Delitschia confertaspora ATCC 74209]|uniref:Uncharacterized protein n=1 Tax=Delitschia confertaspora ATCC 74209 TaxID=1513339 RepID=A0A9P4JH53_9PLEO|nr:hypothetical protein GQ43DRAFT_467064 [Delitschia confertaspora ATCC 74209]
MIFMTTFLGGLVMASHATASLTSVFRLNSDIESRMRRDADIRLSATLTTRQESNAAAPDPKLSTTPQSGDASQANLALWEMQTQQACRSALTSLDGQASNPSGLAVCYNLPFLDKQRGVFQAELRMYNVSAPIDPWVGITAGDVTMTLSYLGATVQMMNGTFSKHKRAAEVGWPPIRRENVDGLLVEKRQNAGAEGKRPTELKVLMYVGKINSNLMGSAMTESTLQPLLIPTIQLTATSPSSKAPLSATLSSQEASFVNGVFSKASSTINKGAAAQASATAAAAKAVPFVLPGTKLAFFPVGLVITSVWTVLLFLAVGLGTMGRIQFRDQYRRRMGREMAVGVRTI